MVRTRLASPSDAPALNTALRQLSTELRDVHSASDSDLEAALTSGTVQAILADDKDTIGVALFSPVFSTTNGGYGAFVSDLWVRQEYRNRGIGTMLLDAVLDRSRELWGARVTSLVVYDDNHDARAFYASLGFSNHGRFLSRAY